MKKRILAMCLASASILAAVSGCQSNNTSSSAPADSKTESKVEDSKTESKTDESKTDESKTDESKPATEQGKVVNIYAWNEEFKGFFEKYYTAEVPYNKEKVDKGEEEAKYFEAAPGKKYVDAGVKFNWVITPSENGAYQQKLDTALMGNADAATDDKVDFFLAEADYIHKYVNSDLTMDVSKIGVEKLDTEYAYTIQACSSDAGVVKGVSFQCCPSGMIYRRSIAKAVLGTDDPAEVQKMVSDWTKFDEVAAKMKAAGYTMTASFAETYRAFSNNATNAWVTDGKLTMPSVINTWLDQAEKYVTEGYTLTAGIWDDEKTDTMYKDGKNFCNFGPAWYFNFCMPKAWGTADKQEAGTDSKGDWALCAGPQAHFWGGTWIVAATGTDNDEIVADVMNAFTKDEKVCEALVKLENQFSNNTKVNEALAKDETYGNALLGGQNDVAIFCELAKNIKWENATDYDQLLNEGLQAKIQEHLKTPADISAEQAMNNFKQYVVEKYPTIVIE